MTTRLARRLPMLLAAAVLASVLAACGPGSGASVEPINVPSRTETSTETPTGDDERIAMSSVELVRATSTGGMCQGAAGSESREGTECSSTMTVFGDGTWMVVDESGTRTGTLASSDLNRLISLTYRSDAAKHPKGERSCDSWVDGRDVTLTYVTEGDRKVTVSSCDYDLSRSRLVEFLGAVEA